MSELPRTIAAAAEALRDGTLSAASLTETLLARAHAANDALGAFIQIADETALAAARQADADFAAGIDRGPLQGIPLAIKDIIATEDAPTTANSRVMDPAWGRREDATVMRKLRQAGAIMLGKTVLHEYACGWPDAETGFPMPKNPWDLTRTAGGSSSGTGIAVAADLAIAGLGTDTGGSIRGPSAFCGLSGIKQTFGLVSKEGCVPLGYSLDHIGPMAHTVWDCAVMLQVMAGYDPKDPTTVDRPVPDMLALVDGSLEGVRIGVPVEHFFTAPGLEPEVKAGVLDSIKADGVGGSHRGRGDGAVRRGGAACALGDDGQRGARLPRAGLAVEAGAVRPVHARGAPGRDALHGGGLRAGAASPLDHQGWMSRAVPSVARG